MSRTQDHHVISLFVGPIEEQPDGGFVRSVRWINRHGEESEIALFAEAGPGCLRLHSEAERRLDEYALKARMVDPQDFSSQAGYDAACRKPYTPPTLTQYTLPETDAAVDLIAEARDYPTMFGDPPGGAPEAAQDNPPLELSF